MFVAPLSLPSARAHPPIVALRVRHGTSPAPVRLLLAWLVAGLGLLAMFPPLRGGAAFGGTAPFWLVAAPLINLGWRLRGPIATALRAMWVARRRPVARRQARRA